MAVLLYFGSCALEADKGSFANHTLATHVMPNLKTVRIFYRLAPLWPSFSYPGLNINFSQACLDDKVDDKGNQCHYFEPIWHVIIPYIPTFSDISPLLDHGHHFSHSLTYVHLTPIF